MKTCQACDTELSEVRADLAAQEAPEHDGLLLCGACRELHTVVPLLRRARVYVEAHDDDQAAAQLRAEIDAAIGDVS